jgi:hypothetical protein
MNPDRSDIADDPWVIFHGTSSRSAAEIEEHGFLPSVSNRYSQEIIHIKSIYENMDWAGEDQGGFCVLSSYSAGFDLRIGDETGLLFFSKTFDSSLLYASSDFSGGEKVRAIRKSISDLYQYLEHEELRERHMQSRRRNIESLTRLNAHPKELAKIRSTPVDLSWLEEQLDLVSAILSEVNSFNESKHSVVYALRMDHEDLPKFEHGGSMGICTKFPVSLKKIVAKMIVPSDFNYYPGSTRMDELLRVHAFADNLLPVQRLT